MVAEWRQLKPGEPDLELIGLALSVSAAVAGLAWLWLRLPWPQCEFRALLGLPCLTCGSTRAAVAFLHGDLLSAWRFNPLATSAYASIAVFDVYALIACAMRLPRLRIGLGSRRTRQAFAFGVAALAGINWIYLLRTN